MGRLELGLKIIERSLDSELDNHPADPGDTADVERDRSLGIAVEDDPSVGDPDLGTAQVQGSSRVHRDAAADLRPGKGSLSGQNALCRELGQAVVDAKAADLDFDVEGDPVGQGRLAFQDLELPVDQGQRFAGRIHFLAEKSAGNNKITRQGISG